MFGRGGKKLNVLLPPVQRNGRHCCIRMLELLLWSIISSRPSFRSGGHGNMSETPSDMLAPWHQAERFPEMSVRANSQFRLSNSQRYLVNANTDTNHSANPTNLNGNSKR